MPVSSLQDHVNYPGLNDQEVQQKLVKNGFNELPSSKPKNFFTISFEIIKEPMFLLLITCCLLYIILGDLQEALTLSAFVVIIIGITLFQSWKTERTLSALKDLTSPKTLVARNGQELHISSRELVVDDIMILNEGDKVSADAIVLDTINLIVDESTLTGESVPVKKNNGGDNPVISKPGEEASCIVYNGTLVTQGKAYTKVIATGLDTELGKIGKALESIEENHSRFQKEIARLVSRIVIIAGILCLVIVVILATRNGLIKALLTSLTFAIAMLPEEIPAVMTIFMALGAWRISQKNVLTRHMSAIETLGSITVLCTDKTGTLTENKMTLNEIYANGKSLKLNKEKLAIEFQPLIEFSALASKEKSFDPMEKAITEIISSNLIDPEHIHKNWSLAQEYPLSKELLAMTQAWKSPDEVGFSFYTKGSPEAIFNLCHLNADEIKLLTVVVEEMASRGLRILGVAKSKSKLQDLPAKQHDIDFEFSGLLGFLDPVRAGVKEAVRDCYSAGIRVIMITGDYHATAQNIAKEIGLKNPDKFIIGTELEKLNDVELQQRIQDTVIFSRVAPEQKLRIVDALRKNQEIIGMTGDGVNDAPALKSSDVGIAMGARGTEVARESADLILLDDNFSSVVSAIRLGRGILENLKKALSYIIAIHVPIAGLTLVPVIFGNLPIIFFPIHVAFLELVIDPTCTIVFESELAPKDIMTRAPRKIDEPILNHKKVIMSLLQGLFILLLVLLVYGLAIHLGKPDGETRMLSFETLLAGNLLLTFINKSWKAESIKELFLANKAFLIVLIVVPIGFTLILSIPMLREMFYF